MAPLHACTPRRRRALLQLDGLLLDLDGLQRAALPQGQADMAHHLHADMAHQLHAALDSCGQGGVGGHSARFHDRNSVRSRSAVPGLRQAQRRAQQAQHTQQGEGSAHEGNEPPAVRRVRWSDGAARALQTPQAWARAAGEGYSLGAGQLEGESWLRWGAWLRRRAALGRHACARVSPHIAHVAPGAGLQMYVAERSHTLAPVDTQLVRMHEPVAVAESWQNVVARVGWGLWGHLLQSGLHRRGIWRLAGAAANAVSVAVDAAVLGEVQAERVMGLRWVYTCLGRMD